LTRFRIGACAGAGLLLTAVGVAMRVNNAVRYPPRWGFDAMFNERYVARLMKSWALPAPDADWSTAHPPLYYYLSAAIGRALGHADSLMTIVPTRLVGTLAGLSTIALAVALVRRVDPEGARRALLAAALLLFLPVHIYMSAMLNEEILASALVSAALVGVAWQLARPSASSPPPNPAAEGRGRGALDRAWLGAAAVGFAAGLAFLTKLSGALVVATAALSYGIDGLRRRRLGPALGRVAAVCLIALAVGGWYYLRNLALYGYLYPQDLATHSVMFEMPPGTRSLGDYLRLPLATWTDPQPLSPDLLHSIWGATYMGAWHEGHGHFLPAGNQTAKHMGTLILVLALLPTAAFAAGVGRGVRRALREPGADLPLLLLVVLTLAGYVAFTWSNPWFPTVKASYLLGLSVPFAFYGSEVLASWTRGGGARAVCIWAALAALSLAVCATFTYGLGLWELTGPGILPGLDWSSMAPAGPSSAVPAAAAP